MTNGKPYRIVGDMRFVVDMWAVSEKDAIDRVLEAHPAALIEHGGVAQVDAKSLTVLGVENNVKE